MNDSTKPRPAARKRKSRWRATNEPELTTTYTSRSQGEHHVHGRAQAAEQHHETAVPHAERIPGNVLAWRDLQATQQAFLATLKHIRVRAAVSLLNLEHEFTN